MELYLIRHTKPHVAKGICYGQTDLDVVDSFLDEAEVIRPHLPASLKAVYSSPLQRCRKLAEHLFDHPIQFHPDLMELNCGEWEMQHWDEIDPQVLQPWMDDFVQVRIPMGESYVDLYERVVKQYEAITQEALPAAIVAHGGVIRSILSHVTQTPLIDSFKQFPLHYGCVAKIDTQARTYTMLANHALDTEQHKPTRFTK
jgi:alpha-ribazole phosphatase